MPGEPNHALLSQIQYYSLREITSLLTCLLMQLLCKHQFNWIKWVFVRFGQQSSSSSSSYRRVTEHEKMKRHSSFKDKWRGSTKSLAGFLKPGQANNLSRQPSFGSLAEGGSVIYREEWEERNRRNIKRSLSKKVRDALAK